MIFLRKNTYYVCPVCNYHGCFESVFPETGERKNAKCPSCGALERHRLQYLVMNRIFKEIHSETMSMLHFAPEPFFTPIFRRMFGRYVTADLHGRNVDRNVDMTQMCFGEGTFDVIYASHVLTDIKEDLNALSEIRRVLKPSGLAVLAVPIFGESTVEYEKPSLHESGHVRCPGEDYFDRYRRVFSKVDLYRSTDFDGCYQTYLHEDRSRWPDTMPLRPKVPGTRHIDIVPVCYK
jgi:SAM-dependent methyltransferase